MNRTVALVLTGMGLALAGLALWVLDLSARLSAVPPPGESPVAGGGAGGGGAEAVGLARRLDSLEGRLAELGAEVARLRERAASSPAGAPAAGGEVPVPGGLEEAVEAVLRKREEEERLKGIRIKAERVVMRLGPDLSLTDAERRDLLPLFTDYLDRRDRLVRSKVIEGRERDAAVEALDADRDRSLQAVLSPEKVRAVVQRLGMNVPGRPIPGMDDPDRGRGEGLDRLPPR